MHRPIPGPRRLVSLVAALLLALLCIAPATAYAAPGDEAADPAGTAESPGGAGSLTVGLEFLGSSATITLPGQNVSQALTLAVPEGTVPATLTGRVSLPAYVTGGFVDVLQGDRTLSRTPVTNSPNAPITLPLNGIQVDEGTHSALITLRSYLRTDDFCQFDPEDLFRIVDAAVAFRGTPVAPSTVGDFLPPVLTKVTMYVPTDPRPAEGAAAVSLATAIVAQYQTVPLQVVTRALPRTGLRPPTTAGPTERQIVIADNLPGGIALADGGRYLALGGDKVATEAAFLTTELSRLAMASKAIPGPSVPAPQLAREVSTLADIGVGNQHVTTAGWPTVTAGIDQTRLGRPSKDVRVQLRGTYTPLPVGTGGRVVVRVGDRVIDSWPVEDSGAYDRWVSIPNDALDRFTELSVTVERGNSRTACGDAYRTSLSLSSDGEIESQPADPPLPAGFGSLPQSLMPRTQLAWTRGDIADVTRGVALMTGLQRLSPIPLGVDLVSMDALNSALPTVLISGDGTGLPDLDLPVTADKDGTIKVTTLHGQPTVTNVPAVPFGSLQVVRADGRTVLVATSTGAPELLDAALDWLGERPGRWASIHGVAMLQADDKAPVFVAGDAPIAEEDSGLGAAAWTGIGIGIAALLAAIIVAALVLRRHLTRRVE